MGNIGLAKFQFGRVLCAKRRQVGSEILLQSEALYRFVLLDSVADILCPAAKLWNIGYGT